MLVKRTPVAVFRGSKYYIELVGRHDYPNFSDTMSLGVKMYNLTLKWDGVAANGEPRV